MHQHRGSKIHNFAEFLASVLPGLGKPIFVQPLFSSPLISFHMNQLHILTSGLLIPSSKAFSDDLHENRGYHEEPFPTRRNSASGSFRKTVFPLAGVDSGNKRPRTSSLCPRSSSSRSDLSASPRPSFFDRHGLRTGKQPGRHSGLRIFGISERSGTGAGRIYTITIECRDASGNKATETVIVKVPKSQGK